MIKALPQPVLRRHVFILLTTLILSVGRCNVVWAQDDAEASAVAHLDIQQLFHAGGVIGIIILALSVAMVALIVEHLVSIRRRALMPPDLAEELHGLIQQGQFQEANQRCLASNCYLGRVLSAGLVEVGLGYSAIEKGMEDASTEQAARLFRKIEYLSVIGTIAPMLGLLGTVWGMILAFLEFEAQASPQPSDLAPGISKALVTTLMGLSVAVPALASFAIMRNRIDELVAETSLLAEHVFADYKRALALNRKKNETRKQPPQTATSKTPASPNIPSVTMERDRPA